jgi:plastocyanin
VSCRRVCLAVCAIAACAAVPSALAHPGHGPITVDVGNFAYKPADIVVGQGDAVVWTFDNAIDRNHSITAGPGQADAFDSDPGTASPPQKDRYSFYTHTFNTVGTFSYFCKNHAGMRGTVKVVSVAGTVDTIPPTVSRVRLGRTRGCGKSRRGCRTTRTVLAFDLSEKADVIARVQRRRKGKWRNVREFDISGRKGRNRRKLSFRRLKPGAYKLLLRAYDPGGLKSQSAGARFRVR